MNSAEDKQKIRGYKIYRALISQAGAAAPTVTVLENGLGEIVWTRTGAGVYVGTLAGAFTNSTTCFVTNSLPNALIGCVKSSANAIGLTSSTGGGVATDALLTNASIEIRVEI
jgi:hypothetical protein